MTDFRFSPGDLVSLWGRELDIRRVVDTPSRRAYVTASGVYYSRATVDNCAELIHKANQANDTS